MNLNLETFRFTAPVFVAGVLLVAFASPTLKDGGHFKFEPNPGALYKSPFGRTMGMALQGPITRFWDRGIGAIEASPELIEGSRPDEKLFDWITKMRETKSAGMAPAELKDVYQDYAMARIEKKLSLAWKMDPRNFGNYAIYQMFLWEGFTSDVIEPDMAVRELSLQTLESSLTDKESLVSLLTAGQAAYDLVFAARTSKNQEHKEMLEDIDTYGRMLPRIIKNYEDTVVVMKSDGRWEQYSEVKKREFRERKRYLDHLSRETATVLGSLSDNGGSVEWGGNS